jgi:glucan endo-1,3-alpha-glucosidase
VHWYTRAGPTPSDAGSDAFALNVGHEDWQKSRMLDAYAAALQLQTGFKLFLSFDMT